MRLALKPRARRTVDIAVVPMINIVFLLLLYFLVAGRLTENTGPTVQLPIGGTNKNPAPITLTVHVTASDGISINGKAMDEAALRRAFAAVGNQPSHHVLIRADARASAQALHQIMAAGDAEGLRSFELATLETSRSRH
ncbi:MAG: biopolymer transporter ExbD [Gammaproteobacteria bacterium]|nr:biopolymer transporter ExbD [Gammaproteobacteria bacterium]MDE0270200.1 biopolymer transporter ExbD [Gammaproteobacteria bacterium]